MYWRGPAAWNYDGRTWTQAPWLRGLPPARVQHGDHRDYQLEGYLTDRRQLVALDLAVAAPEGAHLANDYGMTVRTPLSALTRWRMRASAAGELRSHVAAPAAPAAGLCSCPLASTRARAPWPHRRREAGADDAALVRRALDWIRTEFAYTLETPLPGRNAVDEFLFDRKQGYCEHFSSAFVVLMRAAGVPARVVTDVHGRCTTASAVTGWSGRWMRMRGPRSGCRGAAGCAWTSTAAVAPERVYDTLDDRLGDGVEAGRLTLEGFGSVSDWLRRGWNDLVLGFDAAGAPAGAAGRERLGSRGLASLFGLCAVATLAWMVHTRRGASANAIRCCGPGIAWMPAMPAWDWAANRMKPRATGRDAWRHAVHKAPICCFRSAAVFAAARYAPDEGTSGLSSKTCAGTAHNRWRLAMNLRFAVLVAAAAPLSACATAPKPLQGSFTQVKSARRGGHAPGRCAGPPKYFDHQHHAGTQLDLLPAPGRARWAPPADLLSAPDATDGRFIACRAASTTLPCSPKAEVTFIGKIEGYAKRHASANTTTSRRASPPTWCTCGRKCAAEVRPIRVYDPFCTRAGVTGLVVTGSRGAGVEKSRSLSGFFHGPGHRIAQAEVPKRSSGAPASRCRWM